MAYKYDKLCGRIVEIYGTREKFAEAMGMANQTLSCKLNNKTDWKREEILKAMNLLHVDMADVHDYFFTM